ncbi:hypothetical protein ABW16_01840 [Mycolicibacter heraklionensis]|uniref:Uncharacterized protein n=1 Tax=Mycolicibacter heraklionensis TaxID=512402 RepID=A0ABR5FKQ1_9MYCO|nr:hypothetical protein [Mycolicibacter heraklionensis]KLO31598.1 hypothetical protein ABW16_01840 [Mycolicibacter heraklionensis]
MITWLSDRNDPRVQAALERSCGVCTAPAGHDCHTIIAPWRALSTGIVHMTRVPKRALFGTENPAT